jgi:hypothetical protein
MAPDWLKRLRRRSRSEDVSKANFKGFPQDSCTSEWVQRGNHLDVPNEFDFGFSPKRSPRDSVNSANTDATATAISSPASSIFEFEDDTAWPFPETKHLTVSIDVSIDDVQMLKKVQRCDRSIAVFGRIQKICSLVIQHLIVMEELLQCYETSDPFSSISPEHLTTVGKTLDVVRDPIREFFVEVEKYDTEVHKSIIDTRIEWTRALRDITSTLYCVSVAYEDHPKVKYYLQDLRVGAFLRIADEILSILRFFPFKVINPEKASTYSSGQVLAGAELPKVPSLKHNELTEILWELTALYNADVFHFVVYTHDGAEKMSFPESTIQWTAAALPGSLSNGSLTEGKIRTHISQRLGVPSYNFEYYSRSRCSENGTNLTPFFSWTHNVVNVILDPLIDVVVNRTALVQLEFSELMLNKAHIPISHIEDNIKKVLEADDSEGEKSIVFYLNGTRLKDRAASLFSTGLLSESQLDGLEQITLRADYGRPLLTCMTCLEDKFLDRFPSRISNTCQHDVTMCKNCVRHWINERLNTSGLEIPCPECTEMIQHDDVKRLASESQFQR